MFSELGVTFRVLANKEVLNVMPIIDKNRLEGIPSGTSQTLVEKPHPENLGPLRKAQCIPDKKYLGHDHKILKSKYIIMIFKILLDNVLMIWRSK